MSSQVFRAADLAQYLAEAREGDPAAREALERDIAPLVRLIAMRPFRQTETVLPPRVPPPLSPGRVDALTRRICRRLLQLVRGDTLVAPQRETLPGDKRP